MIAGAADHADGARRYLLDPAEQAFGGSEMAERQQRVQAPGIDGGPPARVGEQRLRLAAEPQRPCVFLDVERLDAEAVAREHEFLLLAVPQRDGEDAFEPIEQVRAPRQVAGRDDLGIAGRARDESMRPFELGAQRRLVVDLAVVDDDDAAAGGVERLVGGGRKIADGEPPMRQRDRPFVPIAFAVRPAVRNRTRHRSRDGRIGGAAVKRQQTGDSAHATSP